MATFLVALWFGIRVDPWPDGSVGLLTDFTYTLITEYHDRRIFCRHNDVPYQIRIKYHNRFENMTFDTSEPTWHTDIPRLRKGKVGSQVKRIINSIIIMRITRY